MIVLCLCMCSLLSSEHCSDLAFPGAPTLEPDSRSAHHYVTGFTTTSLPHSRRRPPLLLKHERENGSQTSPSTHYIAGFHPLNPNIPCAKLLPRNPNAKSLQAVPIPVHLPPLLFLFQFDLFRQPVASSSVSLVYSKPCLDHF